MEELLFRGRPEVVDADLADYFGSIPHADLLKSVARPMRRSSAALTVPRSGSTTSCSLPSGDHIIFIGHVERYAYTDRPTLLFCRGKYMRGEPLVPP